MELGVELELDNYSTVHLKPPPDRVQGMPLLQNQFSKSIRNIETSSRLSTNLLFDKPHLFGEAWFELNGRSIERKFLGLGILFGIILR